MDCVVAGSGVAPTPTLAWTDGAAESAPSVADLFADTLDRLTGDIAAVIDDSAAPSEVGASASGDAPRKARAKDPDASIDASVEDSSDDGGDTDGYTVVCQVSWQPICVFPELPPSSFVASTSNSIEDGDLSAVQGLAADPIEGPVVSAERSTVSTDATIALDPVKALAESPVVTGDVPVEKTDSDASPVPQTLVKNLRPVERDHTAKAPVAPPSAEMASPLAVAPDTSANTPSPQIVPGAARSLARALESLNPAKPVDAPAESTSDPASRAEHVDKVTRGAVEPSIATQSHAEQFDQGQQSGQERERKAASPEVAPLRASQLLRSLESQAAPQVAPLLQALQPLESDLGLTPTTTRVAPQDVEAVVPQIVKAMRMQLRDGIGEAQIRLKPEHLGEVRIEIKVEGDRVSAVLQVERPEVRQAIESQSHTLRSGLAAQGLKLDDLHIKQADSARYDRPDDEQRRNQQHDHNSGRQSRRKQPDREFELDAD